ncbi:MAG: aspartyl protease family protein [Bacteroidales bacterium]|nr:aspartyl protease family protein [Bacteroidales bacterium]
MKLYKTPLKICHIEGGGNHILIKANANKNKCFLLIDTGASNSVFDSNAKAFRDTILADIENDNQSSGFNSKIENLSTGQIKSLNISYFRISEFNAIFTPLDYINQLYQSLNLPIISGIIGCDFLIKYKAIIDLSDNIMVLKKNSEK